MVNKESCANRIREGLRLREMSQSDLCRITGIPKSAMSQYCNGGLVPRQDRTFLIAQALDVSEAWLMGFDVPRERNASFTPININDGHNIIRIAGRDGSYVVKSVTDEQLQAFKTMLDALPSIDDDLI